MTQRITEPPLISRLSQHRHALVRKSASEIAITQKFQNNGQPKQRQTQSPTVADFSAKRYTLC